MKTKILTILTLTLVGVFCLYGATAVAENSATLPWNVDVTFCYGDLSFRYDLSQNLDECKTSSNTRNEAILGGRKAKTELVALLIKNEFEPIVAGEYVFPRFSAVCEFFKRIECDVVDATASFDSGKFTYASGHDGVTVDVKGVLDVLCSNTGSGRVTVKLPVVIKKAVTVAEIRAKTVLKATFSTSFASSSQARCHNVETAVKSLNNTVIADGETFSFNKTVGPRTEQNGYQTAKVIQDGKYTDGVGGGVCQVSTTLYNALIRAEILPSEVHRHTLVSHYVEPGFDAMVSYGSADLKFTNTTGANLYICASAHGKKVTFCVYGVPNLYKVVCKSDATVTPFDTIYVTDSTLDGTTESRVVTAGSDGVKSMSYLLYYDKNGTLVKQIKLRADVYKKVDKVVARGKSETRDQSSEARAQGLQFNVEC